MAIEPANLELEGGQPIMTKLRALGLNDRESQVYMSVAEIGRVAPSSLSRKLHIPRSSVYLTLETLAEKGLVSIHRTKSGTYFAANNSNTILRLIERELEAVNHKRKAASEVAMFIDALLETKTGKDDSQLSKVPKIRYFKGQKNVENMLIDNLASWRSTYTGATDSGLWGFQDHTFVRHYTRYLKHRWDSRLPDETINLFSNASEEEDSLRGKIPNRHVRYLPIDLPFRTTVWIYGSYLVLIQSAAEPHYAYQLEDPAICLNLRAMFQLMWRMTEPDSKKA